MVLKLEKLPDRKSISMTITITPELSKALQNYAVCYQENYGDNEKVAALVPFMLKTFLESDREFLRFQKLAKAGASVS